MWARKREREINRRLKKTAQKKLHNMYSSQNNIRMLKTRGVRWWRNTICL
jgi:hypothetical protein